MAVSIVHDDVHPKVVPCMTPIFIYFVFVVYLGPVPGNFQVFYSPFFGSTGFDDEDSMCLSSLDVC